jgi:hypothetical protein
MERKPPRPNPVRDFVKEVVKSGLEPVIVTTTLPDGSTTTEMRAVDKTAAPSISNSGGIRSDVAKAIERV